MIYIHIKSRKNFQRLKDNDENKMQKKNLNFSEKKTIV